MKKNLGLALTIAIVFVCVTFNRAYARVVEIETKPILVTTKAKKIASSDNLIWQQTAYATTPSQETKVSNATTAFQKSLNHLNTENAVVVPPTTVQGFMKGGTTSKKDTAITEKLKKASQQIDIEEDATLSPALESIKTEEVDMHIRPQMNPHDNQDKKFIGGASDQRILNAAQPSSHDQSISGGQVVSPDKSLLVIKERRLELGTEVSHISYKEPIFDLEEKGWMYGAYGAYTYRPAEGSYLYNKYLSMYQLDFKGSYGQVDYESISGTINNIDDYLLEIRGVLGKDFYVGKRTLWTPYIGLGWRYLNDDSGGRQVQSGAYGYERESRYFYAPMGVSVTEKLGNRWLVSLVGEYDLFIIGQQTSHLSDVPGGYPDLKNKQHDGYGTRGSLRIVHTSDKFNVSMEPFIRYWHIQDSDVNTATGTGLIVTGLEPDNNSTEIGVKLGVQY